MASSNTDPFVRPTFSRTVSLPGGSKDTPLIDPLAARLSREPSSEAKSDDEKTKREAAADLDGADAASQADSGFSQELETQHESPDSSSSSSGSEEESRLQGTSTTMKTLSEPRPGPSREQELATDQGFSEQSVKGIVKSFATVATSKPELLCNFCLSREKNAGIIHGGIIHQICCYPCAKRLYKSKQPCPMCRRKIEKISKIIIG